MLAFPSLTGDLSPTRFLLVIVQKRYVLMLNGFFGFHFDNFVSSLSSQSVCRADFDSSDQSVLYIRTQVFSRIDLSDREKGKRIERNRQLFTVAPSSHWIVWHLHTYHQTQISYSNNTNITTRCSSRIYF